MRCRTTLSFLLIGSGLWLLVGGVMLFIAGGGPGTAAAGGSALASGLLYRFRPGWGAAAYFALLALVAIVTLAAIGLDGWALLPGLGLPILLGLMLLVLPGGAVSDPRLRLGLVLAPLLMAAIAIGWLIRPPSAPAGPAATAPAESQWTAYSRGAEDGRYAPDRQIDPTNIGALRLAWSYRTGETYAPGVNPSFEATPLRIRDRLVFCTPDNDVIALDPRSGRPIWRWNAGIDQMLRGNARCRGVSYHGDPGPHVCAERIMMGTMDARMIALDLRDGRPCAGFGRSGSIDLTQGLGPIPVGSYTQTSPPAIIGNAVVLGGGVKDGVMANGASGVIRAFDARNGRLLWTWDLGRRQGAPPVGFFTRGTPNAWTLIGADPALGQFLVPLGSSTPDYVVATAPARRTASRPRLWRSTHEPAHCAGRSRRCIATCGTMICPRRLCWLTGQTRPG